jgi:hypothetical protein
MSVTSQISDSLKKIFWKKDRKEKDYSVVIVFRRYDLNISWLVDKCTFATSQEEPIAFEDAMRFLKGVFTNKERFEERFIRAFDEIGKHEVLDEEDLEDFDYEGMQHECMRCYDAAVPFTLKEAFEIESATFRAMVFRSINVAEMMKEHATRICTDGIEVNHRKFDNEGNFIGYEKNHNIYEIYEMDSAKIGGQGIVHAVKCWCTTTNKEHFVWVDSKYKDDPLSAIASTFYIYKNLIPWVTAMKRQGDIPIFELKDDFPKDFDYGTEEVPLTKEQYFSWLNAQS